MVSRVDTVAKAIVLAKRDVTSVTVPENEICNRPSMTPQGVLSMTALNKFKTIVPATNSDYYIFNHFGKNITSATKKSVIVSARMVCCTKSPVLFSVVAAALFHYENIFLCTPPNKNFNRFFIEDFQFIHCVAT